MAPRCSAGPEPARQMDARLQGLDSYRASNAANADNWVENERWPHKDDVPLISPLSLSISFHFSTRKCLKHMLLAWPRARVCVFFCFSLYHIYLPIFYPSLDSIAHLSLPLISPRPLNFSPGATVCVYTPGCRGNRGRPHKLVDEQKTQRPSSAEGWKIKFHFFFFFFREGRGSTECTRRGKKNEEVVEGKEEEEGGWMDGVGEMSS